MEAPALDELDQRIVDHLVRDGRISFTALGNAVGLSANAAADRVRALQRRGVIRGFTAVLDERGAGRTIEALVDLRLRENADRQAFERRVEELPAVAAAAHLTGPFDYHLRLSCTDTSEIEDTIATLKTLGGVRDTQTRVILRRLF
jgi:Lrp/AsnC family leucine-responsive transcriptional regulator